VYKKKYSAKAEPLTYPYNDLISYACSLHLPAYNMNVYVFSLVLDGSGRNHKPFVRLVITVVTSDEICFVLHVDLVGFTSSDYVAQILFFVR
jgi:hypothetical protein